jgi:hypothetical protein
MQNKAPFIPSELANLKYDIAMALNKGCFIHKRLCVTFQLENDTTETICFGCNPDRYRELKAKYKRVGIAPEEDIPEEH